MRDKRTPKDVCGEATRKEDSQEKNEHELRWLITLLVTGKD